MIPKGSTAGAAALPFDLIDAAGDWVLDYAWNNLGGGITDDFLVRLPGAAAYANATIARLFQHGDGTGRYELASGAAETDTPGKVCYRWLPSQALVIADVVVTLDAANNVLNWAAHGRKTGDGPIRLTTTGSYAGTGLAIATDYWVVRRAAGTTALATSKANAISNITIDITGAGAGVHTLVDTASTRAVLWDYETRARWEDIVTVAFDVWETLTLEGAFKPADLLRGTFAASLCKHLGLDAIRAAGGNGTVTIYAADGVTVRATVQVTTNGRVVVTFLDLT